MDTGNINRVSIINLNYRGLPFLKRMCVYVCVGGVGGCLLSLVQQIPNKGLNKKA